MGEFSMEIECRAKDGYLRYDKTNKNTSGYRMHIKKVFYEKHQMVNSKELFSFFSYFLLNCYVLPVDNAFLFVVRLKRH